MRYITKLMILFSMILSVALLSACSEQVTNEHLPEYCQTYTGFMSVASDDFYDLLGDINRFNYLSVISQIELEFEANDPANTIDLDGLQCFQNLTSLTLSGQSFKDISQISALINIQKITLINTSVVSIDSFKNLSKVNELTISESKSLQSVDGVEEMTKLTYLDLSDNGIVNIEGLNNLVNLESLSLRNNDITYFPSINMLKKLKSLDISNNNVSELGDDLSGLSNLETLNASNNNICDLSALDDLASLEVLDLSFNNLSCNGGSPDFTGLTYATNLEELYLNDNELTSISDLLDKPLPLRVLHLENNLISDITPIKNFSFLEELYLDHNNISSIGDLTGLTNINGIDLSYNQVSDMTDLLELTNLEYIILTANNLTVLPDLEEALPSLRFLDVSFNQISDISGLEGHPRLEEINLSDNGLSTLSGLSHMPFLSIVTFDEDAELFEEDELTDNNNIFTHIDRSFNGLDRYNWLENGVLNSQTFTTIGMTLGDSITITDSFNDLETLEAIVLDGFGIQEINASSFQGSMIETVILNDNDLQNIDFIQSMTTLKAIDASNNELTEVMFFNNTEGVFDNLEYINVSGNALSDLSNTFNLLPNLSILELQDNPVTTLNNTFNYLPNLGDVSYSFGQVESIVNSLNHSFGVAYNDNAQINIILATDSLILIEDSFNESRFDDVLISNPLQSNNLPSLSILGSFNVDTPSVFAINITIGNNIETIEDSFTNIALSNIVISSIETMNVDNSFNDLIINSIEIDASEYQEGQYINASFNNLGFFDVQSINMDSINLYITPESITDSFNDINSATLTMYSNQELTTIENSFSNSKYDVLSISLTDGIAIENSFNLLDVERIALTTELTTKSGTINASFNNVTKYNATDDVKEPVISMVVELNIGALTNSFNQSILSTLDISNNQINEIDDTNFDSSAVFNLNASNNQFSIFDSSLFPVLLLLDISNNQLTSVASISDLEDLSYLDISNQFDSNQDPTLFVLDGLNDLPSLMTLVIDNLSLQGIDGLKNTGLTELTLESSLVDSSAPFIISDDSFTSTPLTTLDIYDVNLSSTTFLDQLNQLQTLRINLDTTDFTVFDGLPFENTLISLELAVPSTINTFADLSGLTSLNELSLTAPNLTELHDLELGSLVLLELPYDQITSVYNSFNTQGEIDMQESIITPLVNVTLISTSFDGYLGSYDVVSDLTYIDSFNNVTTVNVNNAGETSPTFDTDSFDSVRTMTFTRPAYNSFDFINSYESLTLLVIDTLDYESITNSTVTKSFDLTYVESFTVDEIIVGTGSVLNLTVDLNTLNDSLITISSSTDQSIELSAVSNDISIDVPNADLTLNSYLNPTFPTNLNGTFIANTFVVDYDVVVIGIDGSATNMTVNSNTLQNIQAGFSMTVSDTLTINQSQTLTSAFEVYSIQATNIVLNIPQIDSVIINSSSADLTINSSVDGLIANVNVANLTLNNEVIESADVYGAVDDSVNFNTPLLSTLNSSIQSPLQAGIVTLTTDTTEVLNIKNIDSIGSLLFLVLNADDVSTFNLDVDVYDSEINSNQPNININYLVSGQITLNDSNLTTLTLDTIHFDTFILTDNIPLSSLIERNTLDKTINTQFSQTISLITTETNLILDVLNTELEVEGSNLSNLDVVSENQVLINNSDVDLTISADVESVVLSLPNLESLVVSDGSQIGELTLLASSINQLELGDLTLTQVDVTTTSNMMTYHSLNVSEVYLSGDNLVGIDLDAGLGNNITLNSTSNGNLTADLRANAVTFNTNYRLISVSNDSVLTQLTISNDDLSDVITGFADVSQIDITYQTPDLSVYSENASIVTLNSSTNNETIDVDASSATELNISSTASTNLTVSTNTEQVNISSPGDVLLVSDTINTINMNTENVFSLDVTTPQVALVITGAASTLIVDGDNVQTLDVSSVSANELLLYNTSVSLLDFSATASGINNFDIITSLTEFTIINPTEIVTSALGTVTFTGDHLNTITIDSAIPVVSVLEIITGANELTLNGGTNNLELTALSATSVTMTNALIVSSATFNTPNVASYNLVTMPTESTLNITTSANDIDVAFNGNLFNLVAESGASLTLTKQGESDMEVYTNAEAIDLNMSLLALSTITIIDNELTQLSGTAPNIVLNQTSNAILLVASVTADSLEINANGPTTLMMVGSDQTIQSVLVESDSIRTITTGDVTIESLSHLYHGVNDLSVDSYAKIVNVSSTDVIDELDLTLRDVSPDVTATNATLVKLMATNEYDLNLDTNAQDLVIQLANDISLNWLYRDVDLSLDVTAQSLDLVFDLVIQNSLLNSAVETFEITGRIDGALSISYLEETNNYSYDFSSLEGVTEFTLLNDKLSSTDTIAPLIDTLTSVSFNAFDIDAFGYVSDFIDLFENTNVSVISNISATDLYDQYYSRSYSELVIEEAFNQTIYNSYYDELFNDAVAILTNSSYFDGYTVLEKEGFISTQNYPSAIDVFENYSLSLGYSTALEHEETLGVDAYNQMISDIQTVLDTDQLTILSSDIDTMVEAMIISLAQDDAQDALDNKGFTLIEQGGAS